MIINEKDEGNIFILILNLNGLNNKSDFTNKTKNIRRINVLIKKLYLK